MEIIVDANFNEVLEKYYVQYYTGNYSSTPAYLVYNEIKELIKKLEKIYPNAAIELDIY